MLLNIALCLCIWCFFLFVHFYDVILFYITRNFCIPSVVGYDLENKLERGGRERKVERGMERGQEREG